MKAVKDGNVWCTTPDFFQIAQYVLDNFATVHEAVEELKKESFRIDAPHMPDFDIVLTPHLYPAETMTYMKKKKLLHMPAVAVGTDYTCIPFWEETNLDYYVIPHEDLIPEYVKRGVPEECLRQSRQS